MSNPIITLTLEAVHTSEELLSYGQTLLNIYGNTAAKGSWVSPNGNIYQDQTTGLPTMAFVWFSDGILQSDFPTLKLFGGKPQTVTVASLPNLWLKPEIVAVLNTMNTVAETKAELTGICLDGKNWTYFVEILLCHKDDLTLVLSIQVDTTALSVEAQFSRILVFTNYLNQCVYDRTGHALGAGLIATLGAWLYICLTSSRAQLSNFEFSHENMDFTFGKHGYEVLLSIYNDKQDLTLFSADLLSKLNIRLA